MGYVSVEDRRAHQKAWRASHPDYNRTKCRAWYAKHRAKSVAAIVMWQKNNRERVNAKNRAWAKKNADKKSAAGRAYYEATKAEHQAKSSAWKRANADRVRAYSHNRKAKKLGVGGRYSQVEWLEVVARQQGLCANPYCRKACDLTQDHIVPFALGGMNCIENIQGLCGPCNYSKSDTPMGEWLIRYARNRRLTSA